MNFRTQMLEFAALALAVSMLLVGCERSSSPTSSSATAGSAAVPIRSGLSGTIDRVGFEEGAQVHRGQILFRIDPAPFRAEAERVTARPLDGGGAHNMREPRRRFRSLLYPTPDYVA